MGNFANPMHDIGEVMSSGARMGKVELTSDRHFLKIPRELHFWPWLNLFIAFIHFILTDL